MTLKVVYLGANAFNSKVEKSLTGWAKHRVILLHTTIHHIRHSCERCERLYTGQGKGQVRARIRVDLSAAPVLVSSDRQSFPSPCHGQTFIVFISKKKYFIHIFFELIQSVWKVKQRHNIFFIDSYYNKYFSNKHFIKFSMVFKGSSNVFPFEKGVKGIKN